MMTVYINRHERKRLALFFKVMERYRNLPAPQMLALAAVRMHCVDKGFQRVVETVRRWGPTYVVSSCRNDLSAMARLWMDLTRENEPPPHIREEIVTCIKAVRSVSHNEEIGRRVFAIVRRLDERERWFQWKHASAKRH